MSMSSSFTKLLKMLTYICYANTLTERVFLAVLDPTDFVLNFENMKCHVILPLGV